MGLFSVAKLFGITIRESADDGSDFTNPDADFRRLFLGEDGSLKTKDSAGTVVTLTGSGAGGGTADHNHDGSGGSGGDLDAPIIDGYAIFNEEAAPSTPSSGTVAVYAKSDGLMYSKDDAGVETGLGAGSLTDHNHTTAGGDGGDLDSPLIDGYAEFSEESAPSTPSTGFARLYVKSDGRFYSKGDDGVEYGPFDADSGGGGAPAGFPYIDGEATSQTTSNNTSHSVAIPTASLASGDLLMILYATDGTTTASATGWTALGQANTGGDCSIGCLYKIAAGSETSPVTVTTSASEKAEFWAGRIPAASWHGSSAPEVTSPGATGGGANVEFPSLTPSWGADDNLWLLLAAWDLSSSAAIVAQTQPFRTIYQWSRTTGATDGCGLALVYRWLNAASYDPAEIELSATEQNAAAIFAIRPA